MWSVVHLALAFVVTRLFIAHGSRLSLVGPYNLDGNRLPDNSDLNRLRHEARSRATSSSIDLYHGTDPWNFCNFRNGIDPSYGRDDNMFGKGFYATTLDNDYNAAMAIMRMAMSARRQDLGQAGVPASVPPVIQDLFPTRPPAPPDGIKLALDYHNLSSKERAEADKLVWLNVRVTVPGFWDNFELVPRRLEAVVDSTLPRSNTALLTPWSDRDAPYMRSFGGMPDQRILLGRECTFKQYEHIIRSAKHSPANVTFKSGCKVYDDAAKLIRNWRPVVVRATRELMLYYKVDKNFLRNTAFFKVDGFAGFAMAERLTARKLFTACAQQPRPAQGETT